MKDQITIDGFGPLPVLRPGAVGEVCDIVRAANGRGEALYPVGGRTMLDLGLPPTQVGDAVDLTRLNQVIDYPARDMTITVQAGITIAELQRLLAQEKQRLPIDVPLAERATLGGAIACNVSGPRRYGCGTLRDYVIGISVVNDRGEEIKAGGRVVKNVAGYDLCKLFTGSLGTLGIIAQVTLKVRPKAETSVLLGIGCRAEDVGRMLDRLHESRTRPVCLELFSPTAARSLYAGLGTQYPERNAAWLILVGYEDNAAAVAWQIDQCRQELGAAVIAESRDAEAEPLWRRLTDWQVASPSAVSFKANILPSGVAEFCQAAEPHASQLLAHAGNGIMCGHLAEDTPREQAHTIIAELRQRAVAAKGNLIVTRCPPEWKATLSVWGGQCSGFELMREVKARLDPRGMFNPVRFVGAI